MRNFIARALNKLSKLDKGQIHSLITALAQENDLLEMVLDSMNDGVAVLDTEYRLLYLNKAAERLLPLLPVDPYERPLWFSLSDEEMASFLEKGSRDEQDIREQEFNYTLGGSVRTIYCGIFPLLKKTEIQGKILRIEDVTIKRQDEARLHRAESLASLTSMAAGVAHEIKNPLASMGIYVQIMQKELENKDNPDKEALASYLNVVNEEIERLNGIVVDFLFAVRPMDIQKRLCSLNEIIEELVDFMRFELEEKSISIQVALDKNIPRLMLDEKFIKQAMLNLAKNAEAAMPEGGTLIFSTWEQGGSVYFSLKDSGTGISQENLHKIFEPYFTTRDFGSGLGLTLVYKIVKEHGGDISIRTKENKGTTFSVRFPIPRSDQKLLKDNRDDAQIVFIEEGDPE